MYSCLIVDDEKKSRENLIYLLQKYCPEFTTILEADSVSTAYDIINNTTCDILFLDIEMPYDNGFELLKLLKSNNKAIQCIFVTAFDNYALQAIKFSALDYILKPIHINDLKDAVNKFLQTKNENEKPNEQIDNFMHNLTADKKDKKIALPTLNGFEFISVYQIIRIEASGHYCKIHTTQNKSYLITKNLKEYEDLLQPYGFFRTHHSHLINLAYITKYDKGRTGIVTLHDNTSIPVSERRKNVFMDIIKK